MDQETLQRNLMRVLWGYEVIVILTCLIAGAYLAKSGGGDPFLSLPLLLIAAAEMMRIPLAAWSTRLPTFGQILGALVLLAIAVGSFEGLTLAFEQFVSNRVVTVMDKEEALTKAKDALETKRLAITSTEEELNFAKDDKEAKARKVLSLQENRPEKQGTTGRECINVRGRRCLDQKIVDNNAGEFRDYKSRLNAANLEEQRASDKVASLQKKLSELQKADITPLIAQVKEAEHDLYKQRSLSPMHRLGATIYGVKVIDLTEDQFETVKKWAIFGLAGAFATLSMLVSIVAHTAPKDQKESKLSKAIRAYLARRRKKLVIEKIVEVPGPQQIVHKWIPFDAKSGLRIKPDLTLGEHHETNSEAGSNK